MGVLNPNLERMDLIVRKVSEKSGISINAIKSKSRIRDVKEARWFAMWLIRRYLELSTPVISAYFNCHHTTVLYALDHVEELHRRGQLAYTLKQHGIS